MDAGDPKIGRCGSVAFDNPCFVELASLGVVFSDGVSLQPNVASYHPGLLDNRKVRHLLFRLVSGHATPIAGSVQARRFLSGSTDPREKLAARREHERKRFQHHFD